MEIRIEVLGSFPIFFDYVDVGPTLKEQDMITDVYLPLGSASPAFAERR